MVPYVRLHPKTEASLRLHAPEAELVQLSGAFDAYYHFLAAEWGSGVGWLNVEQDVEIHGSVLPEASSCVEPYCVWPYEGPGVGQPGDSLLYTSLGCTRFSSALLAAMPRLMADLLVRDWWRLDCHIWPALQEAGWEPHLHWPAVTHHHIYGRRCSCGSAGCNLDEGA